MSTATLSFGSVTVNTATIQSLTLTSTGTAPVTVSSAAITGAGFTIVGGSLPVTLNPTQTVTLQVQFLPTATGSASGQITITSDSSTGSTAAGDSERYECSSAESAVDGEHRDSELWQCDSEHRDDTVVDAHIDRDYASNGEFGCNHRYWLYDCREQPAGDIESDPDGDATGAVPADSNRISQRSDHD